MKVARRIGLEYVLQTLNLGAVLLERIVLTGVLLRVWGVQTFADWVVVSTAAAMVALFDLGANLYFANRVLFLVQQGAQTRAAETARAGNLILAIGAVIGCIAAPLALAFGTEHVRMTPDVLVATLALGGGIAVRQAMAVALSVYRAHEQYARQTALTAGADLLRILVSIGLVLAGHDLLSVALSHLLVSLAFAGYILLIDLPARFPAFRYGLAWPRREDRAETAWLCLGYWAQSAPNTAITYLPVLFLAAQRADATTVAQFVLLRTIGNFARMVLQMFAVVLGQEAARRIAIDDRQGLRGVYREAALFLAAQTACGTGLLVALGQPLFALWTQQPKLYDPLVLWLAVATPVLLPCTILAQNLLANANRPFVIALGRAAQATGSALLFFLLPIDSPALRMMTALALAEILGSSIPMIVRTDRLVGLPSLRFQGELLLRSAFAGLAVGGSAWAAAALADEPIVAVALGLSAGGITALIALALVGIGGQRRTALLAIIRARRGGIDGSET